MLKGGFTFSAKSPMKNIYFNLRVIYALGIGLKADFFHSIVVIKIILFSLYTVDTLYLEHRLSLTSLSNNFLGPFPLIPA